MQKKGVFRRLRKRKAAGGESQERIGDRRARLRVDSPAIAQGLAIGVLVLETINEIMLRGADIEGPVELQFRAKDFLAEGRIALAVFQAPGPQIHAILAGFLLRLGILKVDLPLGAVKQQRVALVVMA